MIRKFIPGTEWLYLKIYTGIKTSDIILEEAVAPLVINLQSKNYISQWFFIRYHDPKPHLRLRFCLNNAEYYPKVLNMINHVLSEFIECGEISLILADTYSREIERYGKNTITDAENLFHTNSELSLQCLQYSDEEKIIISLFLIDQTFNMLHLSTQQKFRWITDFNNSFKQEFNADKKLNSQLDKKYREFKPRYQNFIDSDEFAEERDTLLFCIKNTAPIWHNIVQLDNNNLLDLSLQGFFQSIFHMNINRLFTSSQRVFEMIVYDYLVRYYKMELHFLTKESAFCYN